MAGPDLDFRRICLPFIFDGLVGEAVLLALELLPPSLNDFVILAELYLRGTGNGGGFVLSIDAFVDCDPVAR